MTTIRTYAEPKKNMTMHNKKVMLTTIVRGDSPESVPSVADTSVSSSTQTHDEEVEGEEEEESKVTPRRLFSNGPSSSSVRNAISDLPVEPPGIQEVNYPTDGTEVAYYGTEEVLSTTSSDTTVVASHLSMKEDDEASEVSDVYVSMEEKEEEEEEEKEEEETNDNDATHTRQTCPEITVEEVSEAAAAAAAAATASTCQLNVTPRQFADIFVAFQGGELTKMAWPSWSSKETGMKGDNDKAAKNTETTPRDEAHPPPPTPREEFLLRECAALKKIIQEDAVQIMNWKRALEEQRKRNERQDMDVENKMFELRIASDRIDALKKVKEVMWEREAELLETVRVLKMEVDRLSSTLEQKAKGNETIDHHNCDPPLVVSSLRSDLITKEQENVQLRAQVDYLKVSLECRKNYRPGGEESTTSVFPASAADMAAVSDALQVISKRLEAMELRKDDAERRCLEALEQKNVEIQEIRECIQLTQRNNGSIERLQISQNLEEVEVLCGRDGNEVVLGQPQPPKSPTDGMSICCCDAPWEMIRDME